MNRFINRHTVGIFGPLFCKKKVDEVKSCNSCKVYRSKADWDLELSEHAK